MHRLIPIVVLALGLVTACVPPTTPPAVVEEAATATPSPNSGTDPLGANVSAVTVSGQAEAYQFSVTVASPDTGCDQYADWWEVLSPEGELLYRRVLLHSHGNEQPFTRSGGPVPITGDTTVIVRAHMHPGGYLGTAVQGSPAVGFSPVTLPTNFAEDLAGIPPLPDGCAF